MVVSFIKQSFIELFFFCRRFCSDVFFLYLGLFLFHFWNLNEFEIKQSRNIVAVIEIVMILFCFREPQLLSDEFFCLMLCFYSFF